MIRMLSALPSPTWLRLVSGMVSRPGESRLGSLPR